MKKHELTNPKHVRYRTNVRRTHFITKTRCQATFSSMEHTIFAPNPTEAHGTRDTNAHNTHPRSRRTAPQESGDNSTEQGGVPKPQKWDIRKKALLPTQRRLLTSALYPQTTMYRRSPTDPCARFDHTDILHAWQIWHGNLQLCRQPNIWIDLQMINIFGVSVWREKEEKIREGKVR